MSQAGDPSLTSYQRLVVAVAGGVKFSLATIRGVLETAGRSYADLVADALTTRTPEGPQAGDPCGQGGCPGSIVVRTSKPAGGCIIQRLRCNTCRRPAGRRVVPAASVRHRQRVVVTPQTPVAPAGPVVS